MIVERYLTMDNLDYVLLHHLIQLRIFRILFYAELSSTHTLAVTKAT